MRWFTAGMGELENFSIIPVKSVERTARGYRQERGAPAGGLPLFIKLAVIHILAAEDQQTENSRTQ